MKMFAHYSRFCQTSSWIACDIVRLSFLYPFTFFYIHDSDYHYDGDEHYLSDFLFFLECAITIFMLGRKEELLNDNLSFE